MTSIGLESAKVETEITVIDKITIGPEIGLIVGTVINHDKVLTTTQTDFVNKELNTSTDTISVKKIVMQDKSVNTELDNTYQKAILTENDKKKSPAQIKE